MGSLLPKTRSEYAQFCLIINSKGPAIRVRPASTMISHRPATIPLQNPQIPAEAGFHILLARHASWQRVQVKLKTNSYKRKRNSVSSPNIAVILAVRGHHKGYKALRNPHESG
ncbi:hypothetical protein ACLOJK_029217 [Asimina triloba]